MSVVPVGIQDFKKIRDRGLVYVDKTRLIDAVLSQDGEARLVTRPRRFGKSLNLSMLDAYLSTRYAGNQWFEGLRIRSMRPDDPEMNAYPVIRLDMKGFNTRSRDVFLQSVGFEMSMLYGSYTELADSDAIGPEERATFDRILRRRADLQTLAGSLRLLSEMLSSHHGRRVVILVDEYDTPSNESSDKPFHDEVAEFTRELLVQAFAGNGSLRLGVVVGVTRLPGLEGLKTDNILDTDVGDMFGFTCGEVEALCSDTRCPGNPEEAVEWYGGYRFGDACVCNPWSVMSYVDEGFEPGMYWAATSGNGIVGELVSSGDDAVWDALSALASGGEVPWDPGAGAGLSETLGTMAAAGYLTARRTEDGILLSIPNREVFGIFGDAIVSALGFGGVGGAVRRFSTALPSNDPDRLWEPRMDLEEQVARSGILREGRGRRALGVALTMCLLGRYEVSVGYGPGDAICSVRMSCVKGWGLGIVMDFGPDDGGGDTGTGGIGL